MQSQKLTTIIRPSPVMTETMSEVTVMKVQQFNIHVIHTLLTKKMVTCKTVALTSRTNTLLHSLNTKQSTAHIVIHCIKYLNLWTKNNSNARLYVIQFSFQRVCEHYMPHPPINRARHSGSFAKTLLDIVHTSNILANHAHE